jgi:ABC-type glycerol-3-phosphate transport system substrate-binding protein
MIVPYRGNNGLRFIVLALVLLLAACSPTTISTASPTTPSSIPPSSIPPTPEPTATVAAVESFMQGEIRIWLDWDVRELESLHRIFDTFQEIHPAVTFHVTYYATEDLLPAVRTTSQDGVTPTVLLGPASLGPILWEEGYLRNLIDRANLDLQNLIHPLAWDQVEFKGARIGMPLEMQGVVFYRNQALVVAPASSVDDLVGATFDFRYKLSASQMHTCNGAFFDTSGLFSFEDEPVTCWLNVMNDLRENNHVTFNSDEDTRAFVEGQSAWLIEETLHAPQLQQSLDTGSLVVDPWPVSPITGERLTGFVWTENVYLLDSSDPLDLEASWAFIRFLLTPEAQIILSDPDAAGHLPVLLNLEVGDVLQAQMMAAMSSGVSYPLRMDLELYKEPIEAALKVVVLKGARPELAIEMARAKIDQALSGGPVEE